MNKQGKEVLFTPTSLVITNNKGMSVEINDDEGITIISDKDITLKAEQDIMISSATDNIDIVAPEGINIIQGESEETLHKLEDNAYLNAEQIHLD